MAAWAQAELTSSGRNLMLAHDRHDVAELNRIAREWRDAWGFISDRRITVNGTEWAIGDRLVCRRNDYGLGVRNGTRGTIVDLGRRAEHLDLLTDHGETVRLPAAYLAHARHGYALTGHVSQGESVDRTFVLASPERGGAEWAYVAASRHRHDLKVLVTYHESENVEEALARAWSRSQAKSLALDLVDPAGRAAALEAARGDLDAATPERLLARAEELRAARERVRAEVSLTTNRELALAADAKAAHERAQRGLEEASARRARLAERLERVPAWRPRERAEVRAGVARAGADAERHRAEERSARKEVARLAPAGEGDARERAQRLGSELATVERRLGEWRERMDPTRSRPELGRER